MVIEHIFDTINLVFNKSRRGSVKVSQITTAVIAAQLDYFNEQLEIYRSTGVIPAPLKPFIRDATITLTSGVGALPTLFSKEITFITDCGAEGEFLSHEAFDDRKRSLIVPPTEEFPVAKIQNNTIVVLPSDTAKITLTYFKSPADIVYATTTDGDGRGYTFNSGGSTDIEFRSEYSQPIIKLALQYLGVGLQNADAANFGLSKP